MPWFCDSLFLIDFTCKKLSLTDMYPSILMMGWKGGSLSKAQPVQSPTFPIACHAGTFNTDLQSMSWNAQAMHVRKNCRYLVLHARFQALAPPFCKHVLMAAP